MSERICSGMRTGIYQGNNGVVFVGAGIALFLLFQLFGAYFMWYGHPGPIGMDDSITYVHEITQFKGYSFGDAVQMRGNRLLYPYLAGFWATIAGVSATRVFEWGFYVGIILMSITLWRLLRRVNASPLFLFLAFALFAVYDGNGDAHGFFWVVPSFYAMMLFLAAAMALFYSKRPVIYGVPIILLLLITHSLGAYLAAVLLGGYFLDQVLWNGGRVHSVKKFLLLLAIGISALWVMEALRLAGVLRSSFVTSMHSHMLKGFGEGGGAYGVAFEAFLSGQHRLFDSLDRFQYAHGYLWVFAILTVNGVYHAYRHRQHGLLSLFSVLVLGQIVMCAVTFHTYRFFYPLELISYVLIAFGVYGALSWLLDRWRAGVMWHSSGSRALVVLNGVLLLLAGLFFYSSLHWKVKHHYDFKFSPAWYFESKEFEDYCASAGSIPVGFLDRIDKQLVVGALAGNGLMKDLLATPIRPAFKKNTTVIGQNPKYYGGARRGTWVVVPSQAKLVVKVPLEAGKRYWVELVDSGISDIGKFDLVVGKKVMRGWEIEDEVVRRLGGKELYPGFMLPWYTNPEVPWLFYGDGFLESDIDRHTKRFRMEIAPGASADELVLYNHGQAVRMMGAIRIVGEYGQVVQECDLDWGDAKALSAKLYSRIAAQDHPMLWSHGSGKALYCLEASFKDVKVFRSYASSLASLRTQNQ